MDDHVGYLMKQVQHLMRAQIEGRMRNTGIALTFPHAAVLAALLEEPGMSGAKLAKRSMVTPQTVNTILNRLEADGMIERRPDPEHGRILRAYATPLGEATFTRGASIADEVIDRMLGALSTAEQDQLRSYLQRCIKALQAGEPAGAAEADAEALRCAGLRDMIEPDDEVDEHTLRRYADQ